MKHPERKKMEIYYSLSQDIYEAHLDDFLFKKMHTCKRKEIEIYERETFQNIFYDTLLFFTQKSQERKQISYRNL